MQLKKYLKQMNSLKICQMSEMFLLIFSFFFYKSDVLSFIKEKRPRLCTVTNKNEIKTSEFLKILKEIILF